MGKFVKLPVEVLDREDLTPIMKLTYAVILDHMRGKRVSWPGVRTIAAAIRASDKSVRVAVKKLVEAGLITIAPRRRGQRNQYHLPPESAVETTADSQAKSEVETTAADDKESAVKTTGGAVKTTAQVRQKLPPKQTRHKKQTAAKPAAAAAHKPSGAEPEKPEADIKACRAVLAGAGIGEPEQSRLANHPEATVEILTKAVAGDCGAGLKVNRVREALAAVKTEQDTEAKHRARLESETRARAASACRDYRDVWFYPEIARRNLEAMTERQRQGLWERYLGEANGTGGRLQRMGWKRLAADVMERMIPGHLQSIRDRALAEMTP